ncbi:AAA family ATPase [Pedobacter sp. MC2016-24]|uniref:AAA family ATPase n=1 Tax=Pedobacter sp. MC2016-24 TaxID=2780090 RepID=UPI0018826A33|nr:AAA family ATPase [Pedobacter sp. MC2016-24]MBE9597753.1 ATP-binding protein [Pedobacter sp. MC2016-24]
MKSFTFRGEWGVVNLVPIGIGTVQAKHKQLYNIAFSNFDGPNKSASSYRETEKQKIEYDELARSLGRSKRYLVTYEEYCERYPKNMLPSESSICNQINFVFLNYRIAHLEAAGRGVPVEDMRQEIGQPPWDVLREIIKVSNLPFEINDASESSLWDDFELKLTHSITKQEIKFSDLSSGEKVLLSTIFYLYQSQEKNIFPKLLLLDEPDAHLHPSMAQQFLNVVKDVLVAKFNIRVIITTHSPSTVVLAPEESLFEMSIHEPRIKSSLSKNHSVSLLTSGLIFVGNGTRYFLVEDRADVDFYSYVNNQLIVEGKINTNIPLVFIPASTNDNSGGKSVVSSWVDKLCSSGLTGIIHGLIDKDAGNPTGNGIFSIERYSIENYLIDPIVIYAAMMENDNAFPVEGIRLTIGEEYKLKSLPSDLLQIIVDNISAQIASELDNHFNDYSEDKILVAFANGITLCYPKWLLECRGKTILNNICNKIFGSKINQGTLFKAFKRLAFMPQDIADKFNELQKTP